MFYSIKRGDLATVFCEFISLETHINYSLHTEAREIDVFQVYSAVVMSNDEDKVRLDKEMSYPCYLYLSV